MALYVRRPRRDQVRIGLGLPNDPTPNHGRSYIYLECALNSTQFSKFHEL